MRTLLAALAVALIVAAAFATAALSTNPHTGGATGQPNQSCQAQPSTPGHAANAPGSAFNPNGNAGTHYAGTQPQSSKNPKSVSQYDVACFQVSQH